MTSEMSQRNHNQSRTPKNKPQVAQSSAVQTFTHHIRELRRRLFLSVAVSLIVGSVVYYYHDFFIKIVMEPLGNQKLIYLTPAGGFSFVFMVTFYVTMIAVLPVFLYQIYAFIKPAIPMHTGRLSVNVALAATFLMVAGATFGYLFAVPGGLNFLNNFASEYVTASLTADSYLSFVLGYVLGIGILFELPLLLLFWHWIHPLTPKGLLNSERYVIVGAFIAAAVLSPSPDALSQATIAIPIILVYQLGIIAVLVSIKKTKKRSAKRQVTSLTQTVSAVSDTPTVPPIAVQPIVHTQSIQSQKLRRVSMDGMIAPSVPKQPLRRAAGVRPIVPARPQASLVVSQRPRLISDFRQN